MNKLNVSDLYKVLVEKYRLSENEAKDFISQMFLLAGEAIDKEHLLKIKGLGTFKMQHVKDRESVDVNTGERIVIAGRDKIAFTPDAILRDIVNKPFSAFNTVVKNDGVDFEDINRQTDFEAEKAKEAVDDVDDSENPEETDETEKNHPADIDMSDASSDNAAETVTTDNNSSSGNVEEADNDGGCDDANKSDDAIAAEQNQNINDGTKAGDGEQPDDNSEISDDNKDTVAVTSEPASDDAEHLKNVETGQQENDKHEDDKHEDAEKENAGQETIAEINDNAGTDVSEEEHSAAGEKRPPVKWWSEDEDDEQKTTKRPAAKWGDSSSWNFGYDAANEKDDSADVSGADSDESSNVTSENDNKQKSAYDDSAEKKAAADSEEKNNTSDGSTNSAKRPPVKWWSEEESNDETASSKQDNSLQKKEKAVEGDSVAESSSEEQTEEKKKNERPPVNWGDDANWNFGTETKRHEKAELSADEKTEAVASDGTGDVELKVVGRASVVASNETEHGGLTTNNEQADNDEEYDDDEDHRISLNRYVVYAACSFFVVAVACAGYFGFRLKQVSDQRDQLVDFISTNEKVKQAKMNASDRSKEDSARLMDVHNAVNGAEKASDNEEASSDKEQASDDNSSNSDDDGKNEDYNKDPRIRTGAYRIVGVDKIVKAKAGQTVEEISKTYLGPGMECYIEALNGRDIKEGQTVKIPKLKRKKTRKN